MIRMSPRRRVAALLALLIVSLAATQGHRLSGWSPFAARRLAIKQSRQKCERLEADARLMEQMVARIDTAAARSLPPDPYLAASLYHAWLIELLDQTRHEDAVVTPGRIGNERAGFSRIGFTVESNATPEALSSFLDAFAGSGILHKVLSVRMRPTAERSDRLHVTLEIEALSLHHAPARSELISADRPRSVADTAERSLLAALARNPFLTEPGSGVLSPDEAVSSPVDVDAEPHDGRLLIATLTRDGTAEAWVYDPDRKQHEIWLRDRAIPHLGENARVLAIDRNGIEIGDAGAHRRIEIGQPLSSGILVTQPR